MSWMDDFKSFVLRGNLVDLAVGFTVGAAFSTVAKSLVNDLLMPPIGLALGGVDFSDLFITLKSGPENEGPYRSLADATAAGAVTLNYGQFANSVLSLLIVALAMFILIRIFMRIEQAFDQEETSDSTPSSKKCPFCRTNIAYQATRCPNCTSHLEGTSTDNPLAAAPA